MAQITAAGTDSIEMRFVDADLRAVVQALGELLPKPMMSTNVPSLKVTLQSPRPVSRSVVQEVLRGLLEAHQLDLVEETSYFTVKTRASSAQAPPEAQQQRSAPQLSLQVVRLRHARAADVAATINLLFGGGGQFSGSGQQLPGTLSEQLRQNLVPPGLGGAPPPQAAPHPGGSLTGPTVIVPDELTNSLLVRASEEDFRTLQLAIDQLDIRPLQVLIEVLIVEVRKDRSFTLGADIKVPPQSVDGGTISGVVNGGGIGDFVLGIMNMGKARVDAVIRMSQARGDAKIISRPVVLASNNTEARFLVGSQRPFVQISRVQPTDQATRDQVVQYKDVGTKLTVRPTINQDRYVSLLIQQEINQATSETQFDAPIISTREARTQVLVRDGQTIVIGGLRDHVKEKSQSGVPILSGIPIIGGLFGSATRRSTETELYLFLTPRIIATDAEADSVTTPRLPEDLE
jgi:general secretion pathway protein D